MILSHGHALAGLEPVALAGLANETPQGRPDPEDVGVMRVIAELASKDQIEPDTTWRVPAVGTNLRLVASGPGCGIRQSVLHI